MGPVSTAKAPPERRLHRDAPAHVGAPAMADAAPPAGAVAAVPAEQVLYLQRTIGNAATGRAIAGDGRNGPGLGGGTRLPAREPMAVLWRNHTAPRIQRTDPPSKSAPQAALIPSRVAFVREDGLNLREAADQQSKSLSRLAFGLRVYVLDDPEPPPSWTKVAVPGQTGYVFAPRIHFPPEALIAKDPGLRLIRVKPQQTFWGLVKDAYGIQGNEGSPDQNINHFINAIRAVNKPEAFDVRSGTPTIPGRDAAATYLKANVDLWIPSFGVAAAMDVGSGTLRGEEARFYKQLPQRIVDFQTACTLSNKYAADAIARHAGETGEALLKGLVDFVIDAAKILAASTAAGALIGAFFEGVGAVPGALIGFEIGLIILEYYGLVMVIAAIVQIAANLAERLGEFAKLVWTANGDSKQLDEAGKVLADALGILASAAVIALAAYVTKKGYEAIGKTKFAQAVGENRLADGLDWLKKRQQMTTTKEKLKGSPGSGGPKPGRPKPMEETPGAVDGTRVVAEAPAKDGTIKSLADGRTVICRTCEIHLLEQEFAPEVNSLAPDDPLRKRIDAAKSLDPAAKAKAEAQLRGELQDIRDGKRVRDASRREFLDLDDAATAALGEKATAGARLGDIGPVKNPGAQADLRALGYNPDDFRAVQYLATSKSGAWVITVFEAEGGVYYGPHVSSSNF
jgi:hypothetical protein